MKFFGFLAAVFMLLQNASATDVYKISTRMDGGGRHWGIMFSENGRTREFHWTIYGLIENDEGAYEGGSSFSIEEAHELWDNHDSRRSMFLGSIQDSFDKCQDWVYKWASEHYYGPVGNGRLCYDLVIEFCKSHGLKKLSLEVSP